METTPAFPVDLSEYRDSLRRSAVALGAARAREVAARQELKAVTLAALAAGMSEYELVKVTGLARDTVRNWRGK